MSSKGMAVKKLSTRADTSFAPIIHYDFSAFHQGEQQGVNPRTRSGPRIAKADRDGIYEQVVNSRGEDPNTQDYTTNSRCTQEVYFF
jgi:hypothetical protein